MAYTSLGELNASTRRAFTPEAITATIRQASPILDLIIDRKKTHGGQGTEWYPQTQRSQYFRSFTKGGDFTVAIEDKFASAGLDWVHFTCPVGISKVEMLQNRDARYKTFDKVSAQIKANIETEQYQLGRDCVCDGSDLTESINGGTAFTRSRLQGLQAICAYDTAYGAITRRWRRTATCTGNRMS